MGAQGWWLWLAGVLVSAGFGLWDCLSRRPSARRIELWREAARRAGLTRVETPPDSLVGWAGPVHVRISSSPPGTPHETEITVGGPTLPAGLTISPENDPSERRAREALREVEVGDDEFDRAAWVQGPPALAHAVLDRPVRRALQALFEGRLETPGRSPVAARGCLENGTLEIKVTRVAGMEHLAELLGQAIHLGQLLASTAEVPRRIADHLRRERLPRVRLAGLAALVREYPDHPATREALLAAREDPEADVRLRAGIALGPEGREVLRALAGGKETADETASQAVAALEPDLTVEEARALLRNAISTRRLATAKACMMTLGRRGGADAIEVLGGVLADEGAELGGTAAQALAATHDPAAEGPLLRSLAAGVRDVRLAAAAALGEVGTTAAVGPLREAERGDSRMRRAIRQAIAEIQSRLTGAARGQLSLAGGEAGQLSIAKGEVGRLSLSVDPPRPGSTAVPHEDPSRYSGPGRRGSLGVRR